MLKAETGLGLQQTLYANSDDNLRAEESKTLRKNRTRFNPFQVVIQYVHYENIQGVFYWDRPKSSKYGKQLKDMNWDPSKSTKKLKYPNWTPKKLLSVENNSKL